MLTLAGTGEWGAADGFGDTCMLNKPLGICCLSSGVVVVADTGNNCIRLLTGVCVCVCVCVCT